MWIDFQSIGGPPKITEIRLPGIINSALILISLSGKTPIALKLVFFAI